MKPKAFFIIFQGFSVARNCLRPETAPLTILAIKRRLFCNFAKTLKSFYFMGHSGTQSFKKMSKIPISNLIEEAFFSNFALYSKCRHFSITRFCTLIFCNILHIEMNFGNLN